MNSIMKSFKSDSLNLGHKLAGDLVTHTHTHLTQTHEERETEREAEGPARERCAWWKKRREKREEVTHVTDEDDSRGELCSALVVTPPSGFVYRKRPHDDDIKCKCKGSPK